MTSVSPVSVSPPFRPLPTFFQAFTSTSETTTPSITSTPRSLLSTAPLRPTQNDQVQEQVRVQEQQLANIARMQQRQEEWSAAAARSTSGSAGIRTRTGTSVSASSVSRSPSASGSARGRSSSAEGETAVQPARSGAGHARAIAIASGSGNGVREIKVKKEDRGDTATGSWGTVAGGSMMPGLGAGSGSGTAKKGRKKVAKACLACQKSHVTCDDKRPCTRCEKKGIGDQCVEGVRKKAKYLLEEEERELLAAHAHAHHTTSHQSTSLASASQSPSNHNLTPSSNLASAHGAGSVQSQPPLATAQLMNTNTMQGLSSLSEPVPEQKLPDDIWLAPPMANEGDGVGMGLSGMDSGKGWYGGTGNGGMDAGGGNPFSNMSAATSEYAMLDSMFAMDPVFPGLGVDSLDQSFNLGQGWSVSPQDQAGDLGGGSSGAGGFSYQNNMPAGQNAMGLDQFGIGNINLDNNNGMSNTNSNSNNGGNSFESQPWMSWIDNAGMAQTEEKTGLTGNPTGDLSADTKFTNATGMPLPNKGGNPRGSESAMSNLGAPPMSNVASAPNPPAETGGPTTIEGFLETTFGTKKSSSDVYKSVVKPYDYTEGYHALMDFLTKNFERKEILRVVHALASYRPSLIALQMPMSEDDEVFIERSFQRTLIELEKLISYSATPTAVWRRTGEVCYANPEFCKLLQKGEGDLVGTKSFIYQLFGRASVISYWENFSVHAFENTTQNFFQPTTLKVGNGLTDCSCCFTIRRDVFDLPSVVIGQFLPIPQDTV